ncbi:homeobox protein NOBOX isoform X2 [Dendrobates tinctorius]|uniref:homeobox protein NOBOX isoform X2 n=1 Tax=Dendrobates tinctorius TaxID=92724 RepID=UPI003CC9C2C6
MDSPYTGRREDLIPPPPGDSMEPSKKKFAKSCKLLQNSDSKEEPSLLCTEQEEEESSKYNTVIVAAQRNEAETSHRPEYTPKAPEGAATYSGHCQLSLLTVCGPLLDPVGRCYANYSTEAPQEPQFFNSGGQLQPVNLKMAGNYPTTAQIPRRSARCATLCKLPESAYDTGPGGEQPKAKCQGESTEEALAPSRKKSRTLYNIDQLQELERIFMEDHYPDSEKRKEIAEIIGVTPQRIMVWFQNRRAKWRKVEKTSIKSGKKTVPGSVGICPSENTALSSSALSRPETVSFAVTSGHHPYGPGIRTRLSLVPGTLLQRTQSVDISSQHSASCPSTSSTSRSSLGSPGAVFLPPPQEYPPTFHSPPPLRRAGLPMSMAFNHSNHMVPLMLDTPDNSGTPSNGDLFTYNIQECSATETMSASMRCGPQIYYQSNPLGPFQMPHYSQFQRLPVHSLTPTSPEDTAFLAVPANNTGMLAYGNPGSYMQGCPAGHIVLQPGTGGLAFHPSPWNDMYIQGAPYTCPQTGNVPKVPEQPQYSQYKATVLQQPQKPPAASQEITETAEMEDTDNETHALDRDGASSL